MYFSYKKSKKNKNCSKTWEAGTYHSSCLLEQERIPSSLAGSGSYQLLHCSSSPQALHSPWKPAQEHRPGKRLHSEPATSTWTRRERENPFSELQQLPFIHPSPWQERTAEQRLRDPSRSCSRFGVLWAALLSPGGSVKPRTTKKTWSGYAVEWFMFIHIWWVGMFT